MSPPTDASVDGWELITNTDRRAICTILARERSLTVASLASRVADRSTNRADDATDRVYISLHHDHLPRLAERGLVRYAPGDETVSIPADVSFRKGAADAITYAVTGDRPTESIDDALVSDSQSD